MKSMLRNMLFVLAALLATAGGAFAKGRLVDARNPWSIKRDEPPEEAIIKDKTGVVPVVCAVVGLAGICVVGFKKPKRTHLD